MRDFLRERLALKGGALRSTLMLLRIVPTSRAKSNGFLSCSPLAREDSLARSPRRPHASAYNALLFSSMIVHHLYSGGWVLITCSICICVPGAQTTKIPDSPPSASEARQEGSSMRSVNACKGALLTIG